MNGDCWEGWEDLVVGYVGVCKDGSVHSFIIGCFIIKFIKDRYYKYNGDVCYGIGILIGNIGCGIHDAQLGIRLTQCILIQYYNYTKVN